MSAVDASCLVMDQLPANAETDDVHPALPDCLPSQIDPSSIDIDYLASLTQPQRMQLQKKCLYLKALAVRGVSKDGLLAAGGVAYTTLHNWRARDPWFVTMEVQASLEAKDNIEAEAYRRAVEGVDEPVVYQGMVTTVFDAETGMDKVLTVKKYSDSLLAMLLKATDPEKYRENVKQTVDHQGVVGVLVVPGTASDPAAWAEAAKSQQAEYAHSQGDRPAIDHRPG